MPLALLRLVHSGQTAAKSLTGRSTTRLCGVVNVRLRNLPTTRRRRAEDGMKLYDGGRAPNPRRTRIFLAEKGIKVPLVPVDLGALEQMSGSYAAINPVKRVPAL